MFIVNVVSIDLKHTKVDIGMMLSTWLRVGRNEMMEFFSNFYSYVFRVKDFTPGEL